MRLDIKAIGERIKKIRTNRGMSSSELANLAGLSQQYISLAENNKTTPSLKSLLKIAKALNVSLSVLIENNQDSSLVYNLADDDLKMFLMREENMDYIRLAKEIKDKNIPKEDVETFLNLLEKNKNRTRT